MKYSSLCRFFIGYHIWHLQCQQVVRHMKPKGRVVKRIVRNSRSWINSLKGLPVALTGVSLFSCWLSLLALQYYWLCSECIRALCTLYYLKCFNKENSRCLTQWKDADLFNGTFSLFLSRYFMISIMYILTWAISILNMSIGIASLLHDMRYTKVGYSPPTMYYELLLLSMV